MTGPIDVGAGLSDAAREMFAKEVVPFMQRFVDGGTLDPTQPLDPGFIVLWLLEEVQALRGANAALQARLAATLKSTIHRV